MQVQDKGTIPNLEEATVTATQLQEATLSPLTQLYSVGKLVRI